MNSLHDNSQAQWRTVAPILDEAITPLGQADRTAILLRFFEQRDFRAISARWPQRWEAVKTLRGCA